MALKILLADDEADIYALFEQRFRRQIHSGTFQFVVARNGQQALDILQQDPEVDIVLADINMPEMDGLTLLEHIALLNFVLPTILVTAYGDMATIREAMNKGAFDFITKPIDFNDLERTIHKAQQYSHQLRQAQELKALDAMKNRFFVNITHELRTPLSLILAPTNQLLEETNLTESQQQRLMSIRQNARQLLRLINQLMDLHQLDGLPVDEAQEVGDLTGFVAQVVSLFEPSATIKNVSLRYQTDLPAGNYRFDAGKWETILYNLLTNAIRFTQAGSVTVGLYESPTGVRLSVRDTGIGITAHKLPHIFDPFFQGDNQRIRSSDPTGVSLALVKALTRRLGGQILVESQVDIGTEFVVELPLQRTGWGGQEPNLAIPTLQIDLPQSNFLPLGPPSENTHETPPLLLIVEENAELLEYMVAELTTTYRVRTASTGYQGWVIAKEELPDLIITDLLMAGLDGYALIERLKADPATDHIATILLTGRADDTSRLKGLAVGADDYLTKPFHLGELRLRLHNLLDRQQRVRDNYRQQLAQPDRSALSQAVGDQFLGRLYRLIDQRLDDSMLSVEWLADQLAMSRKALYLKVHTLTHLSPVELIRQYRLRKAIDLLRAGHGVSETGYLVGFDSPSYFTRVFRQFYQQTPTDYLKQ
ncbi:response regulator [Spirosoma utsteinense]|uniref:histidine kinase n=1 Tax=Spirosoma utsteinense TaxID=2585773 RepID=A0ABR6WE52_9BACT|nr:response regulator [Spirosoma utsteinense]MBC3788904.1 signal transduction histidine kinase/AraC-like DNA-binding protein [Spirosoma utsteinense]MBC3794768.1 signal transduction histidine kinase/AraC-like DNA-binding protein [Spirosoma utsteinense]